MKQHQSISLKLRLDAEAFPGYGRVSSSQRLKLRTLTRGSFPPYLQVGFQRCPCIPVFHIGALAQVDPDSLLSNWRPQSNIGATSRDAQDCLVHIHAPQVAGGLGGVRGEFPLLPLLVAPQLMHRAPETLGSDDLLVDEFLH